LATVIAQAWVRQTLNNRWKDDLKHYKLSVVQNIEWQGTKLGNIINKIQQNLNFNFMDN